MRLPTPRQWTAIALAAVALPALTYTAWPLIPFLVGLLPEALPLERFLWGLLFATVLVAAVVLARSSTRASPPWLGWLILLAWAVAIAAVTGIVLVVWLILGFPGLEEVPQLSPKDLDAIATRAFAIVAGLGGVALLVISYRRQRTTEADAVRAEAANVRAELAAEREVSKLFTETFDSASDKLGNEHAAVRLAGVHALARLADEAPEGREDLVQMVIDVLCAYLRMPYTPAPARLPEDATDEQIQSHRQQVLEFESFQQVRHTIIRIIGDRLRRPTRWRGKDYDFTGVVFDGGDLSEAHFTGGKVDFGKAQFTGGEVDFSGAHFTSGAVHFNKADFTGGKVNFGGAHFTGGKVDFGKAQFTGGEVDFSGAHFTGGKVDFNKADFAGGEVVFGMADFAGGAVHFFEASFVGGLVSFLGTRFTGGKVNFSGANFIVWDWEMSFGGAVGTRPPGLPSRLWEQAKGNDPGPGAP